MAAVKKFGFDQVFDAPRESAPRKEKKETPPPEPTFSEADLAVAGERGFSEGREAGRAEALASIENAAAAALAQINQALAALGPVVGDTAERCRQDAIGIARAVTRKLIEPSARSSALTTVEGVIAEVLPRIIDEPRVVIRVSDELLDPLQQRLSAITANCGFPGSLILLAEGDLPRPDCRIEWADGGADYDSERLWKEIDGIIERYRAEIGAGGTGAERTPDGDPGQAMIEADPAEQTDSEEQPNG